MPEGVPEGLDNWNDIAAWWRREATTDPVYREDVEPMLERLVPPHSGLAIELGCGEGQWLRWLNEAGGNAFGSDGSLLLLADAVKAAPVVCARLPALPWLRDRSVDTALSVFVLDLVDDVATFFSEAARVVRRGGSLIVVINHPGFTSPGSGPVVDIDGEVLWRWGSYLTDGSSKHPAGSGHVVFYHRSIARLLTTAAESGWALELLEESSLGAGAIERQPAYAGQEGIPRFLGARWVRSSD